MSSKSILVSGAFCLACTMLLGSVAIQLAVGDVRDREHTETVVEADEVGRPEEIVTDEPAESAPDADEAALRLEALMRKSESLVVSDPAYLASGDNFEAIPSSDEAISLFAEMVQLIDETKGVRFDAVVGDPNPQAARRRADVFRNSVLLALRHPNRLSIEERASRRPTLTVRTSELLTTP